MNTRSTPAPHLAQGGTSAPKNKRLSGRQAVLPLALLLGVTFLLSMTVQPFRAAAVLFPTPTPKAQPAGAAGTMAPFAVAGWNVGLDDADAKVIAATIAGFEGVDLWGLAEINKPSASQVFERAAEDGENADFGYVLGKSGSVSAQQLLAIYNKNRFDLLGSSEYTAVNTTGNVRAPLILHLRDKASGQELLFMVNHLYRSKDVERLKQAQLLNAWARQQTLPVVAVGDYNLDWSVTNGERSHDPAYDAMTAGGAWQWVQPKQLVATQCTGWPCKYNDVLDFVFTAGPAQGWAARSSIAVLPNDFPDDKSKSDHRPVVAQFAPSGDAAFVMAPPVMLPLVGYGGLAAAAPTPAPTNEPAAPGGAPVANDAANLRAGPGTGFAKAGSVEAGRQLVGDLAVVGKSADGQWLALANGLWIAAALVDGVGEGLAVVQPQGAADAQAVPARVQAPVAVASPAPTAAPTEAPAAAAPAPPGGGGRQWPPYSCTDNPAPPPNPQCPIKGNISGSGHVYHMPGQRDYCKTVIDESKGERWFCSEEEAEAAGWRAAKR